MVTDVPPDEGPSRRELDHRLADRAYDRIEALQSRIGEATVQNGQLTLRTLVLINGGAAVAILAFLGSLATKIEMSQISPVSATIVYFAMGVAAAVAGLGAAYGVSFCQSIMLQSVRLVEAPPYVHVPKTAKKWWFLALGLQILSVLLGGLSLGLFLWGMYEAKEGIRQIPKVPWAAIVRPAGAR